MPKTKPYVLGIIPARFESTRFPGKMLYLICGKPLIQHTFENANRFKAFDRLLIATDHTEIASVAKGFGAEVVMTPRECINGSERLSEALKALQIDEKIDIVFGIQGDEPCLHMSAIAPLIKCLDDDKEAVMSTAVVPIYSEEIAQSPAIAKCVFDKNHNALYFSRSAIPYRQKRASEIPYYRHLGLYCYRPSFLSIYPTLETRPLQEAEDLEQMRILEHGYRIKIAILDERAITPDVNHPEDVQKVIEFL